jgi:hypothetical protein
MSRRNRPGRPRAQPRDLEVDVMPHDGEGRVEPMAVEVIAVADLHIDPANVRRHPERNMAAIKASLARFDQVKPIVIDANNVVRAGNGTLEAARELGWATIKCVRSDLCGADMVAYSVADNRSAELAEWNEDALGATLRALQDEDFDLDAVGFTDAEVDALFGRSGTDTVDDVTPPEEFPAHDESIDVEHICPRCGYSWSGGKTIPAGSDPNPSSVDPG